ncbi:MAG: PorV/PorQ family protein [candidate division KSB1 bacterium]|nr:PorV/PorQ family protein [candidate division KSB1 bacterium]
MRRPVSLLIVMALLVLAGGSQAAVRKAGINGMPFLKIGVGARQVALGSAVTTLHGTANAMFWNPAGIDLDAGATQVALNHNKWIISLDHEAAAITHGFGNLGTFGLGFIYMGINDIPADRDIAPPGFEYAQIDQATSTTYNYYDAALIVSYAKRLTDRFRMGGNFKLLREHIDDQDVTAFAIDLGAIYETGFRDLTLGARLSNLGSDVEYFAIAVPIPLTFSIGASMSLAREENSAFKVLFDATKPQDAPQLYFAGAEWTFGDWLAVRGGYKFNYSGVKDVNGIMTTDEGASFGAGIKLPMVGATSITLDYAFTDFGIFDNTHRFSLTVGF